MLGFHGDSEIARSGEFVAQARQILRLPNDAALDLQRVTDQGPAGRTVQYALVAPIVLQGAEYGIADGVSVDEAAVASLRFDASGAYLSADIQPRDPRHLELVRDQVRKLAATDSIQGARNGERRDPKTRPWRLVVDAHGRKRLERVHFA